MHTRLTVLSTSGHHAHLHGLPWLARLHSHLMLHLLLLHVILVLLRRVHLSTHKRLLILLIHFYEDIFLI